MLSTFCEGVNNYVSLDFFLSRFLPTIISRKPSIYKGLWALPTPGPWNKMEGIYICTIKTLKPIDFTRKTRIFSVFKPMRITGLEPARKAHQNLLDILFHFITNYLIGKGQYPCQRKRFLLLI